MSNGRSVVLDVKLTMFFGLQAGVLSKRVAGMNRDEAHAKALEWVRSETEVSPDRQFYRWECKEVEWPSELIGTASPSPSHGGQADDAEES